MNTQSVWPEIFAVVAVAFCAAIWLHGWPQWSDVSSQTAAAWVQAIGSVAAIVMAFLISRSESQTASKNLRREQALDIDQKLQAITDISDAILSTMADSAGDLSDPSNPADTKLSAMVDRQTIVEYSEVLRRFPLHEQPYVGLAPRVMQLLGYATDWVNMLDDVLRALETGDEGLLAYAMRVAIDQVVDIPTCQSGLHKDAAQIRASKTRQPPA